MKATPCDTQSLRVLLRGQRGLEAELPAEPIRGTVDAAGRIVVPDALRKELGLQPGQVVEIRASQGRLEIEAAPTLRSRAEEPRASTRVRLKRTSRHPALVSEETLCSLTVDQLRETLEWIRR